MAWALQNIPFLNEQIVKASDFNNWEAGQFLKAAMDKRLDEYHKRAIDKRIDDFIDATEGLSPDEHARKFLAAQGLMLALRGVPGIYFHSLVGTENYAEGVEQTGEVPSGAGVRLNDVEFSDGVVKAELGQPDMRKPIQHAITAPERIAGLAAPFDPIGIDLTFSSPDRERFPALDMGYAAGRKGGNAPAVLNAADEVAVAAFLARRLGFHEITGVVADALDAVPSAPIPT